ncbi:MFS transporter [Paenibacillus albidus]|uniref:MFS transporter n=1 Tax=Paenibacillus albidus TaxID=2041023 RepID=A0A917D6Q8_9BACL|nr:MFS transporter [Paenibacillus albidus]GGG12374.1 MFS transporter [Paenibacillus albidus]
MSQSNATTTATASTASGVPAFRENIVVSLLGFVIILVVMNTMMFNLALPQITKDYALSPIAASWIVTGYSIVFAIMSITFSRLSDFVPLRTLFITGLGLFGAASLIGLFSNSFILLLGARLIQAAGAASIPGLSIVLITRYIPVERRGNSMAIVISASSLGLGLGPVIGGSVTQYMGWHYLFIITGISLLLIPVFFRVIPKEAPQKGSFDLLGAVLIGIGTTGILLFLTGREWIMLGVGVLALLLFWLRIHRAGNPFVQPALFRNKTYMSLSALGIVSYINNFSTLFLLPQVLAHLYGLTPAQSGLIIFPGAIVSMLLSGRVGRLIDRHGNILFIRYSPWLLMLAAILFALFADTSFYSIMGIYVVLSVGFSTLTTSVSNQISEILPGDQIGAGMGFFQLIQFFSGAFSVAVTSIALDAQQSLPMGTAYSNIFWGMTAAAATAIICSLIYGSYHKAKYVAAADLGA